jgi:hypothetical protein
LNSFLGLGDPDNHASRRSSRTDFDRDLRSLLQEERAAPSRDAAEQRAKLPRPGRESHLLHHREEFGIGLGLFELLDAEFRDLPLSLDRERRRF